MPALARARAPRDIEGGDRRWAEASPTRSGPEGSSRNEIHSGSSAGLHSNKTIAPMTDQDLTLETEIQAADEATSELFAAPPGAVAPPPYTVLARKYRPRSFDDLIGQ